MQKISLIFSTFNDLQHGFIQKTIPQLSYNKDLEIIIVDFKSTDGTSEFLSKYQVKIISTQENSRAKRLNIGITNASNDMVLLNHPRSILGPAAILELQNLSTDVSWGAFTHQFDNQNIFYKFTSWYSNIIRLDLRNIAYLDHCIFFKKKIDGQTILVPEVDIFEDTLLSYKLRSICRATRLKSKSITSAVRFSRNGFLRQSLLNFKMKLMFHLGVSANKMNKQYEAGLNLNSKYK